MYKKGIMILLRLSSDQKIKWVLSLKSHPSHPQSLFLKDILLLRDFAPPFTLNKTAVSLLLP